MPARCRVDPLLAKVGSGVGCVASGSAFSNPGLDSCADVTVGSRARTRPTSKTSDSEEIFARFKLSRCMGFLG